MIIPTYAIHHDADLYPMPDIFDPNRFQPNEVQRRHHMSYLPFGEGPRNCIGIRFGLMQTRIGLITVLRNFALKTCEKTMKPPIVFSTKNIVLTIEGGLYLELSAISTKV